MNYRISETEDYYPISVLCNECGLEVEPSKEAPDHNLKMWKCEDEDTGELLAAAVAGYRDGCYVLEQLAVKKEYRNEHLGEKMLQRTDSDVSVQTGYGAVQKSRTTTVSTDGSG